MKDLMTVDIGHLYEDYPGLIKKYGQLFSQFQESLNDKKSPLVLFLEEEAIIPIIRKTVEKLKNKFENFLLLGIGGSALGARTIQQFINGPFYNFKKETNPKLFILDNLDPLLIHELEKIIEIKKTALIYVSKSGSTPETAAQFIYFYHKYKEASGNSDDIVIICDKADNGINQIAKELGCHLFHIPKNLPGRYSVLSSAGFFPAELVGVNSTRLLKGAKLVYQKIKENPLEKNALFLLAASLYELSLEGKNIHIMFNYSNFLEKFGLWFVQLWAESLGKKFSLEKKEISAGTTPVMALGATDQHSVLQLFKEGPKDKVIGFLKVANFGVDCLLKGTFEDKKEYSYFKGASLKRQLDIEQMATEISLVNSGVPCYKITLKDFSEETLGALFYFYEALVVFTANLFKINPYNQPGVEEGKNMTYALMGREDFKDQQNFYQEIISQYEQKKYMLEL